MTLNEETNNEKLYIRMPQDVRLQNGLQIGDYIHIKDKNDGSITLMVEQSYINDVFSDGALSARVTESIYNQIEFENHIEVVDTITLGADPEYYLVNRLNGSLMDAMSYFTKWEAVGSDGLLGEVRPEPSLEPREVTANIGRLLATAKSTVGDDVSMLAGSYYMGISAGFHLHYGLPQSILANRNKFEPMINSILKALDFYVASISVIVEGEVDSGRRSSSFLAYGKVSDYRISHNTLEYRVVGGCFLKHPILTDGLLALGATVVEDAISRYKVLTENFTKCDDEIKITDLYPNLPTVRELFRIICTPDSTLAEQYFATIKEDVSKMLGYHEKSTPINLLFDNVNTYFSNNIGDNWGLGLPKWNIETKQAVPKYAVLDC